MAIPLHEARSLIRKAKRRVAEGEGGNQSLNLTAMMDIMTILLIFMIESMSITTSPLSVSVVLPPSSTRLPEPEQTTTITIASSAILVDGLPVVPVLNGDVDASEKGHGQFGIEIDKLHSALAGRHEKLYEQNHGEEPSHELTIIADKNIPFRLLYMVMDTAGLSSAKDHPTGPGFSKFRLIVLRPEPNQ